MKRTILVVDDLAIFREPIEVVLRTQGYAVVTASNGVEALRAVSNEPPDLVLLDLSMPVLDGMAVLKALRENAATRNLPVLVLSAKTEKAKVVEAVKLGISGYLLKANFSLPVMLDRVRQVFEASADATPATEQSINDDAGFAGEAGDQPREPATASAAAVAKQPAAGKAAPASAPPAKKPALAGPGEPLIGVARKGGGAPAAGGAAAGSGGGEKEKSWKARQAAATAQLAGKPSKIVVKAGDDLKSLKPIMSRSEVMKRVNTEEELQGFSPTVTQVLKLTASSQCSMDDVSKAVGMDHAVALKILKLANSSIFSRGDHVDTVQKAVLRIGIQSIRQAVLNIGVVERFGGESLDGALRTPLFWEHSIATGIIAAELAHGLGQKDADIAFTAGLLHDLGRILYAERLDKEYADVLEAARTLRVPLEQAEARLLLMSHAEVMDKVLHAWHFPKDLISPIVFHHAEAEQARTLVPRQSAEVLRLSLADRLSHAMLLGSSGNDVIYPTHEHCMGLNVGAEIIAKIESTAREQTDETKFALLSRSSGGEPWPRLVEEVREEIGAPVRALFVGEHGPVDAYRIFCETVSEPAAMGGAPNVAVVHIATPKDRETASRRLQETEQQLGLSATPLPAVVLSPEGKYLLDDAAARGRACRTLPTPTPVADMVEALRRLVVTVSAKAA